jgi:uncharacterized protein with LGFP repeats
MSVCRVAGSVTVVKLTVQVKLLPTPVQAAALEETLHACNEAAAWVSQAAFSRTTVDERPYGPRYSNFAVTTDLPSWAPRAANRLRRHTA